MKIINYYLKENKDKVLILMGFKNLYQLISIKN